MRDGFVFYKSFAEQINLVPDEAERAKLRKAIIDYGLYGTDPEFGYPLIATFTPIKEGIDRAAERFDRSVENGKKGGRPSKWIEREEAERLYEQYGNWKDVAEVLGVDEDTLRKARYAWKAEGKNKPSAKPEEDRPLVKWEEVTDENGNTKIIKHEYRRSRSGSTEETEKPKNPNNNIQNKNYTQNNSYDELKGNAVDGTRLEAVPPPRGYEWNGDPVKIGDKHARQMRNIETGEYKYMYLE